MVLGQDSSSGHGPVPRSHGTSAAVPREEQGEACPGLGEPQGWCPVPRLSQATVSPRLNHTTQTTYVFEDLKISHLVSLLVSLWPEHQVDTGLHDIGM